MQFEKRLPAMQRLSARSTVIFKRVFPIFWFGFLTVFFLIAIFAVPRGPETLPFLIVPAFMAVFGYVLMKAMVFGLVDEVWDAGEFLVVRNKGEETTVRLEEIVNVSYTTFQSPGRATLRLRNAGRLGKEIAFVPVSRPRIWPPFSPNEVIDGLIDRIDAARRKHGG
jgi:hypothetical protein